MRTLPIDLIATIKFRSKDQGGRNGPTPDKWFGCPLDFEGELYDCFLDLTETGPVSPGDQVLVPVGFRHPELIKARLKEGDRFTLWEMRAIADGVVNEVVDRRKVSVEENSLG
jgi:hypothetical protein